MGVEDSEEFGGIYRNKIMGFYNVGLNTLLLHEWMQNLLSLNLMIIRRPGFFLSMLCFRPFLFIHALVAQFQIIRQLYGHSCIGVLTN